MYKSSLKSVLLLVITTLVASNASSEVVYEFTDLGTLGGVNSYARAINNAGQVVGYSYNAGNTAWHAAFWNGTSTTDLGTLGGIYSFANGINSAGRVVGSSMIALGNSAEHAALWSNSAKVDLGTLGGTYSYARAINDSDQVVGFSYFGGNIFRPAANVYKHATMWSGTTQIDLGTLFGTVGGNSDAFDINNVGQVVGWSNTSSLGGMHATVWNHGSAIDLGTLTGGWSSYAGAINNAGQIVGVSRVNGDSVDHATLWSESTIVDLGTLGGTNSFANDINNIGQIVGYSDIAENGARHATLWNGSAVIDLNSYLDSTEVNSGWVLGLASGINDSGWIVGEARNTKTGQEHAFLLIAKEAPTFAVPEPGTLTIVILGIFGMCATRLRKHLGARYLQETARNNRHIRETMLQ